MVCSPHTTHTNDLVRSHHATSQHTNSLQVHDGVLTLGVPTEDPRKVEVKDKKTIEVK
jgi:hypothetical protein